MMFIVVVIYQSFHLYTTRWAALFYSNLLPQRSELGCKERYFYFLLNTLYLLVFKCLIYNYQLQALIASSHQLKLFCKIFTKSVNCFYFYQLGMIYDRIIISSYFFYPSMGVINPEPQFFLFGSNQNILRKIRETKKNLINILNVQ